MFQAAGSLNDRPRSGRPKVTTPQEDDNMRLLILRNRFKMSMQVCAEILEHRQLGAARFSTQTVRRRLHVYGLRAGKPARKQPLLLRHRAARRQWRRAHRCWVRAQWANVLFSDELRFCFQRIDGIAKVWRRMN